MIKEEINKTVAEFMGHKVLGVDKMDIQVHNKSLDSLETNGVDYLEITS